MAKCRKWTKKEIDLLGTDYDLEIGKKLSRSKDSVALKRRELGISSFRAKKHGGCVHWTQEQILMLSHLSTSQIVEKTGFSPHAVRQKRLNLGIRVGPKRNEYTPEEIALLGTNTDYKVGKVLKRRQESVKRKRNKLGIPKFLKSA